MAAVSPLRNGMSKADADLERDLVGHVVDLFDYSQLLAVSTSPMAFADPKLHSLVVLACQLHKEGQYSRGLLAARWSSFRNGETIPIPPNPGWSPSQAKAAAAQWLVSAQQRFVIRSMSNATGPDWVQACDVALSKAKALGAGPTVFHTQETVEEGITLHEQLLSKTVLSTGFPTIDHAIGGLLPGTTTVLAARPGVGKTTIACQWALEFACSGRRVLVNTLEMSPAQITLKLAGIGSGLHPRLFFQPWTVSESEQDKARNALRSLDDALDLPMTRSMAMDALELSVQKTRADVLVFDYLQILPTPSDYRGTRPDYLSEVANRLADLTRRTGVVTLLLSQLRRFEESDRAVLKGSGGIEEAADYVLFLLDNSKQGSGSEREFSLSVEKARFGQSGIVQRLFWDESVCAFSPSTHCSGPGVRVLCTPDESTP